MKELGVQYLYLRALLIMGVLAFFCPDLCAADAAFENRAVLRELRDEDEQAFAAMETAEGMYEEGRWRDAIDIYQRVCEMYPEYLFPVGEHRYTSVAEHCRRKLLSLPPQGRELYKILNDPKARELFQKAKLANDVELLAEVETKYFCSSVGDDAGKLLGDILFERGRMGEAAEAWRRVRTQYPHPSVSIPDIMVKEAVCYSRLRDATKLRELEGIIAQRYAKHITSVGGRPVGALDFVRSMIAALPTRETVAPMPGPMQLTDKRWSAALPNALSGRTGRRVPPDFLPVRPLVKDGMVYAHNGSTVYAFDLRTGKMRWLFPEALWGVSAKPSYTGQLTLPYTRDSCTGTAADGRYYTTLYVPEASRVIVGWKYYINRLYCFDAWTGKVVFEIGAGKHGQNAFLRQLSFVNAPAIANGSLYVGAVSLSGDASSYLCCFDARTGEFRWARLICSTTLARRSLGADVPEMAGTSPVVDGGVVFYSSNMGVLAAMDTLTGSIVWLTRYPQLPQADPRRGPAPPNAIEKWSDNPILVAGQTVFVTPRDSDMMLALRKDTGEIIWQRERGRGVHMLGIFTGASTHPGAYVIVSGRHSKSSEEQGKYVEALSADTGETVWRKELDGDGFFGRGAIAGDYVYAAARRGFVAIDAYTGKQKEKMHVFQNETDEPGNIVISDYVMVSASAGAVNVFHDVNATAYVRERLTDNPDDPLLNFDLAQAYFDAADFTRALKYYKQVLSLAASLPVTGISSEEIQSRIAQCHIKLGDKLAKSRKNRKALSHYRDALDFAASASEYLVLAEKFHAAGDDKSARACYRDVINRYGDGLVERDERLSLAAGGIAGRRLAELWPKETEPTQDDGARSTVVSLLSADGAPDISIPSLDLPLAEAWKVESGATYDLLSLDGPLSEETGDVLFVSTGHSLLCLDKKDGSILWENDSVRLGVGWLGVQIKNELEGGVLVIRAIPDTPAQRAGLSKGDSIIKLNETEIGTTEDLINAVGRTGVGEKVTLLIRRGGEKKLDVVIGARPSQSQVYSARRMHQPRVTYRGPYVGYVVGSAGKIVAWDKKTIMAVDTSSGEVVWRREFAQVPADSQRTARRGSVYRYRYLKSGSSWQPAGPIPVMAAQGALIFAAGADGQAIMVDGRDGSVIWERQLPAEPIAAPHFFGGRMALISERPARLLVMDVATGTVTLQFELHEVAVTGGLPAVAFAEENAFIILENKIRALRMDSGKTVWSSTARPEGALRLEYAGGVLVAMNKNGEIAAYSPAGALLWEQKKGAVETVQRQPDQGVVVINGPGVPAQLQMQRVLRNVPLADDSADVFVNNGVVYLISTGDRGIFVTAYSVADGTKLWRYLAKSKSRSFWPVPPMLSAEHIVLSCVSGKTAEREEGTQIVFINRETGQVDKELLRDGRRLNSLLAGNGFFCISAGTALEAFRPDLASEKQ